MRTAPNPDVSVTPSFDYPAANTAAVVTLAATAGEMHVIKGILFSYSATPTGGRLTVAFGGTTKLDLHVAAAGPVFLDFGSIGGLHNETVNEAVVVTLAAGSGTVVGKLTVLHC